VLLSDQGARAVITDFGIAHRSDPRAGSDAAWLHSGLVGTPAYMSPEQVEGEAITGRSDLYSMGVMLFELTTGQLPFHGESPMAMAAARLGHEPPHPRKLRPELSDELAAVILRCLARGPADRYASGDELRAALEEAALAPPGWPSLSAAAPAATAPAPPAPDQVAVRLQPTPPTSPARRGSPSTGRPGQPGAGFLDRLMEVQRSESALAVLPFRNGGSADEAHWAEGFTLDMVETLSLVPGLRVRAARPGPGGELDPARVGQELGVDAVVEGSLRRQGDRVRATLRVVSVLDGFQIHARRFDRGSCDLQAIAEEAAHDVAAALMRPFALPPRTAISSAAALDLYLRGRREFHRFTRESMKVSVQLFQQALALAPDNGRILSVQAAVLARAWTLRSDIPHPHEAALAAAQRARALAPELGEPHFAVAVIRLQEGRILDCVEETRQAVTKSPGLGGAREVLGRLLTEANAFPAGEAQLEVALALEPDLAGARLELAKIHALGGDAARALAVLDGMPEESFAVRLMRMRVETWCGQNGWARLDEEAADNALARELATCMRDEQQGGLLPVVPPETEPVWRRTTYIAQLRCEMAASLGRYDRVLALIAQLAQTGLFDVSWLRRCPLLDPVRKDPRYTESLGLIQARADEVLTALRA
jgi:serine/threonine-protein kinase